MELHTIYHEKPLQKTPLLLRIFKIPYKPNIIIEINNYLAKADTVEDVSLDLIATLCKKYKVKLYLAYKKEREYLFKVYLNKCLEDKFLSEVELEDLRYLRRILFLSDYDMNRLIKDACMCIYKEDFNAVIADTTITEEEKKALNSLQANLRLEDEVVNRTKASVSQEHYERYLSKAIADERLSPDEEEELAKIAKNLGLEIDFDHQTQLVLQKYRLYWTLENGDIPTIRPFISLQKNEHCYFMTQCNWHEHRRVTRRINYSGPAMRLRIMKGVYWRMGSLGTNFVKEDVLQLIDTGMLYVTNKRLIFMGEIGNKTIRLNKILDFTPYSNGVDIQKNTGKSPFLEFTENLDIFSMIVSRVMEESS